METSVVKFRPTQVQELTSALQPQWNVKEYGWVPTLQEIQGFTVANLRFSYSQDPEEALYNGATPIVASRLTPANQRAHHLNKQICFPNSTHSLPLTQLISEFFKNKLPPEFSIENIPMVDCTVFFPMPEIGAPTYFAGAYNNPGRYGSLVVFDGKKFPGTRWVTNKGLLEPVGKMQLVGYQDGEPTVFSIVGILNNVTPQTLTDNSITAVFAATDLVQQPTLLQESSYWRRSNDVQPVNLGDDLKGIRGGNALFAKRGENKPIKLQTIERRDDETYKHMVLVNIFPMVIPNSLSPAHIELLQGM